MDKLYAELFELTSYALKSIPYDKPLIDGDAIFDTARENGLTALIFSVLVEGSVGQRTYTRFQKEYYRYQTKDLLQGDAIALIRSLFRENQIRFIFLKGAYLKQLYPDSHMRGMGDIDMLVQKADQDRIRKLLLVQGFKNPINGPTHDFYSRGRDVFLEVHPQIDLHFDKLHLSVFDNVWNSARLIDECEAEMAPELHMVYLLSHLAKHLKSSGVGLRQVLDIGVMLDRLGSSIDQEQLSALLAQTRLKLFFLNLVAINKEYFNLESLTRFLADFEYEKEFLDEAIMFFIASGIHGTADGFNRSASGITKVSLEQGNARKSKLRYLFSKLFLKYEDMVPSRPYLKKWPILLPVAWVIRWFDLAFHRTRRSIAKLRELRVDNDTLAKQYELYKRLGL